MAAQHSQIKSNTEYTGQGIPLASFEENFSTKIVKKDGYLWSSNKLLAFAAILYIYNVEGFATRSGIGLVFSGYFYHPVTKLCSHFQEIIVSSSAFKMYKLNCDIWQTISFNMSIGKSLCVYREAWEPGSLAETIPVGTPLVFGHHKNLGYISRRQI